MRRRIYWLLPDLASARRTMNDLLLARIAEPHIHFVAREGADTSGLHAANVLQTSDVVRAAQVGLVVGGAVGIVLGGLFGVWASSMIGVSTPSKRLQRFESAIEKGQFLLMVDVPRSRIDEIESMLEAAHPEGHFEGVEPDIPAFP